MQKVTLEQLKKLLPKDAKTLSEDDKIAEGFSFKQLCNEYHRIAEKHSGSIELAYDAMISVFDKHSPPIELVGIGSSRTVFACIGGKCVKIAINKAGIAQNSHEYKLTAKRWWRHNYQCFAQSYAEDSSHALLLSECCAPIDSYDKLFKALGVGDIEQLGLALVIASKMRCQSLENVIDILENYCKANGIVKIEDYIFNINTVASTLEWFKKMEAKIDVIGYKVMSELIHFWSRHGEKELLPSDVSNIENWGFAIRQGKIMPVIVDAGFSQQVADEYYS